MIWKSVAVLGMLAAQSFGAPSSDKFPPRFKFGAATAAYQVEGAWNISDKGEVSWDRVIHTKPGFNKDGSNADVASDSYHQWRRDIEMLDELGLNMYRFSISWSRLLPTGFPNIISEDGKNYYNNLIDGLLKKGIEPFVTIHHWDLPQSLEDLGGWSNPLITDWFADYARVVFSLFADRVKLWVTLNEPLIMCEYERLVLHPNLNFPPILKESVLCNKNALVAHAKAYRIYEKEFKNKYQGKISLAMILAIEPETPADEEIATIFRQYWEGRYGYPIYSEQGGWPPELIKFLGPTPELPHLTTDEIQLIKGSSDFYALNYYITYKISLAKPGKASKYYDAERFGVTIRTIQAKDLVGLDWYSLYPEGIRNQLNFVNKTYGVNEIIIAETGVPSTLPDLNDSVRVKYTKEHLEQVLLAINDGINVTGYTVWSLMDTFEWIYGYTLNFGLYAVDFKNENRTRTPRDSAKYLSKVIRTRSLNPI